MTTKLNADERSKSFLVKLMIKFLQLNKKEIGERNCNFAIRYYKGESIDQIALDENLSGERIRQLIKIAEAKIEKYINSAVLADTREELANLKDVCKSLELENTALKISLKLNGVDGISPLSKFNFSNRTMKILDTMSIRSIQDLIAISESDLLRQRNAGIKTISEIETALRSLGFHLEV
jgi:prophage antirepressor-like protein